MLPGAVLAKAHMPDLAKVVPIFNVESIERTAEDTLDRRSRRRVEFESIDFNKRFIATVPSDHDPVALRELFSPAFIDWTTRIPAEVDFGITDLQLFFHWKLRERSREELKEALNVRRRHLRAAPAGDGGERPRHLQAGPLARGARAVPAEAGRLAVRSLAQPAPVGPVEARPLQDEIPAGRALRQLEAERVAR